MEVVQVDDANRTSTFYVERFMLRGVSLSATLQGEEDILECMIGTPIDPDELRSATSVNAALAAIAVNASHVCCAMLTCVHRNPQLRLEQKLLIVGDIPPPPLLLDGLPAVALQHIAHNGGLRLASKLRCCSSTLCDGLQLHTNRSGDLAVRTWGAPGPGSCEASIVRWDAASCGLTKTSRPGHAMVIFSEHLFHISALLEFDLVALPSIGAVEFGVLRMSDISELAYRAWYDGCGRAHVGEHVNGGTERAGVSAVPCGERVREGDRVGVLYDARSMGFAMLLNGKLAGAPLPLKRPWAGSPGYRFFLRFDCVPGVQVRLVANDGALDVGALMRQPPSPPRPIAPDETEYPPQTIRRSSRGRA